MSNNPAIDTLLQKRQELITERDKAWQRFDDDIKQVDLALFLLTGKEGKDLAIQYQYDDENPDQIKMSAEEM